jgi:hypothetical protein
LALRYICREFELLKYNFKDMGAYGDQKAAMNETITLLRKNSSASSSSSIVSASAIAQIPSMETSSDMINYS